MSYLAFQSSHFLHLYFLGSSPILQRKQKMRNAFEIVLVILPIKTLILCLIFLMIKPPPHFTTFKVWLVLIFLNF